MTPNPDRDLSKLDPQFRAQFEAWFTGAQAAFPQFTFGVTEALRSAERQAALWAQGRTMPGPVVTWTRHSRHQDGLAVDWHLAQDGRALWDPRLYAAVYEAVPLEPFGLRTLEGDLVHVELAERIPVPAPEPERLILLLDAAGTEVGRVALPADADVLVRASSDGQRFYVRPDTD